MSGRYSTATPRGLHRRPAISISPTTDLVQQYLAAFDAVHQSQPGKIGLQVFVDYCAAQCGVLVQKGRNYFSIKSHHQCPSLWQDIFRKWNDQTISSPLKQSMRSYFRSCADGPRDVTISETDFDWCQDQENVISVRFESGKKMYIIVLFGSSDFQRLSHSAPEELIPAARMIGSVMSMEEKIHEANKTLDRVRNHMSLENGEHLLFVRAKSLRLDEAFDGKKKLHHIVSSSKKSIRRWLDQDSPKRTRLKETGRPVSLHHIGATKRHGSRRLVVILKELDSHQENTLMIAEQAKAKTDYMAHMSHEIRTPLGGIISILPVFAESGLNAQQMEWLQIIRQSSTDLMRIVCDVLDMAKLDSKRMTLFEDEMSLRDCIESCYNITKPKSESVEMRFQISDKLPKKIIADEGRLRQVLINVLSNAVKFTSAGWIETRAECERGDHCWRIRIEIEDTGIGIPVEKQALIFDSYRQADESTTREYGGTGLGLAISRKLMRLMPGGDIRCSSKTEEPSGTTFILEFDSPILDQGALLKQHGSLLEQKSVLVVDDNETNRKNLRTILESWGMVVREAENGEKFMQDHFGGAEPSSEIAVAIIDYRMPRMDGVAFGKMLRGLGLAFPIILTTSAPEEMEAMAPEESELFSSIQAKPLIERQLLASVLSALGVENKRLKAIMSKPLRKSTESKSNHPSGLGTIEKSRAHILVAEDFYANQKVIKSLLKHLGYRHVRIVENGKKAVEAACEDPRYRPDIILMDIRMPVMNGIEASQSIHATFQRNRQERPKILALTAQDNLEPIQQAIREGVMDGALGKPVDVTLLEKQMDDLLQESSVFKSRGRISNAI